MLKEMENLPAGLVGVYAEGRVTAADYETVLTPILEKYHRNGERIRFLYQFGPDFSALTPAAAVEDFRIGLKYLRLFEKCAIVSDLEWIRHATHFMAHLMPCPVKSFKNSEREAAQTWLAAPVSESNLDFELKENGVLVVKPQGALRREDFERLSSYMDPWIEAHHDLGGLVIRFSKFPGWEDFGSFVHHLDFVKAHHRKVRRVGLTVDGVLPEILAKTAAHFVEAEVKVFPFAKLDEAVAWAGRWGVLA
jgi:hypothetical protein